MVVSSSNCVLFSHSDESVQTAIVDNEIIVIKCFLLPQSDHSFSRNVGVITKTTSLTSHMQAFLLHPLTTLLPISVSLYSKLSQVRVPGLAVAYRVEPSELALHLLDSKYGLASGHSTVQVLSTSWPIPLLKQLSLV